MKITFNATQAEINQLDQYAENAGMSRSAYIRHTLRIAGAIPKGDSNAK
jgi:hypothetical protein